MRISIETPVFKGAFLERCIDSVLTQSSPDWHLSLLWDGGDALSRQTLERLERQNHPQVSITYSENRGIARARHSLTAASEGEFILPLDDDDVLPFHAVERFLSIGQEKPWASVLRAKRIFIDEEGKVVHTPPWFPFEARNYQHGMVTDVFNHSQPYLIRRAAYDKTDGWEGFPDFQHAGEDCDIYLKLEEQGTIELVDETLYYYRINSERASLVLTDEAAFEMWRRLADKTIERLGLPLSRINDRQPFEYKRTERPALQLSDIDFVVVGDGKETTLATRRTTSALRKLGVAEDAILTVQRSGATHLEDAFANTDRAAVCFIEAGLDGVDGGQVRGLVDGFSGAELAGPRFETLDGFVANAGGTFDAEGDPVFRGAGALTAADLSQPHPVGWLSERLVLIRREVWKAVGGFDTGYALDRSAMIDFCLRARQRDFACLCLGNLCVVDPNPDATSEDPCDRLRFHEKWDALPAIRQSDLASSEAGDTE